MQIKDFKQLREQAGSAKKRTVAVAAAHDPHTLEAVLKAHEEGVLDYLLVGKAHILHCYIIPPGNTSSF